MIHLDTSFAIDLLRERARGKDGAATRWLRAHPEEELRVGVHVACELAAGARLAPRAVEEEAKVRRLLAAVVLTYPDERCADTYAEILAWLTPRGERISAMDALIATAALRDAAPLLTRNVREFERVPGLRVERY